MRLLTVIPQTSTSVIVQFRPDWRVTCFIPECKRTLSTHDGVKELKIPNLLLMHSRSKKLERALNYYKIPMRGHNFHIMIPTRFNDGKLLARAWGFGTHTGENGTICWGRQYPKTLQEALQMFFSSRFNYHGTVETTDSEIFKIRDITYRVFGDDHWNLRDLPQYVMISDEEHDIANVKGTLVRGSIAPPHDLYSNASGGYGSDSDGFRFPTADEVVGKPPLTVDTKTTDVIIVTGNIVNGAPLIPGGHTNYVFKDDQLVKADFEIA